MAKKLLKFTFTIGISLLVLLASFWFSGEFLATTLSLPRFTKDPLSKPMDLASIPANLESGSQNVAVVRLGEVMPLHPKFGELVQLQNRLAELNGTTAGKQGLPNTSSTDLDRERERLIAGYQSELAAIEKASWDQVEERVSKRQRELKEELKEQYQLKVEELTQELANRADSLRREYQVQILSRKVKLEILESESLEEDLTTEISELEKELGNKLAGLEKEFQARASIHQEELQKEFNRKLQKYSDELVAQTEAKLEDRRREFEEELQTHLDFLNKNTPEPLARPGSSEISEYVQLAQKVAELRTAILSDIRRIGEECAYSLGLETVVLTEESVFGSQDITQKVKDKLSKKEGSPIGAAKRADYTQ